MLPAASLFAIRGGSSNKGRNAVLCSRFMQRGPADGPCRKAGLTGQIGLAASILTNDRRDNIVRT